MSITVVNNTHVPLLFSDYNGGTGGIPFDSTWVDPKESGTLDVGGFHTVSVGVQVQSGGRWIGGDPAASPVLKDGQTFTFTTSEIVS